MKRRANYATVAWAVILAVTLAACGSDSTPTGTPTTTANITFKTDPAASVWIDGENKGVTPIVIEVAEGTREVVLKADGFEDLQETIAVEAGKDLTVDTGLLLAGTDVDDYKRLLATLGIEHEGYGEAPKAHRGYGDKSVMLYWPQGTTRKAALRTYRIEVTPEYADDGYIVFRQGKKEIHREKFEANDLTTERALPASVMEAVKAGKSFSWGVYYDSKRKKPEVAKFKIASSSKERSYDRKLAKVQKRKAYLRSNPVMRAMANVDLLRNNRYYAEALSYSLSMINTWPDTEMPFKSIAFCLERLKLRDTSVYEEVGQSLRGAGRFTPKKSSLSGSTDLGTRKGGQSSGIPTPLVAPRVRQRPTGPRPGGMGVMPTPDAQKRKPGPIVPDPTRDDGEGPTDGTADPLDRPDAPSDPADVTPMGEMQKQLDAAQEALDAFKLADEEVAAAQAHAEGAAESMAAKNAAVESARTALSALEAAEAATPGSVSAADMQAAHEAVAAATQQAEESSKALEQAQAQVERLTRKRSNLSADATNTEEAQANVDALKRKLEKLEQSDPSTLQDPASRTPEERNGFENKTGVTQEFAQEHFDNALRAAEQEAEWFQQAEAAAATAETDARTADQALQTKIDAGGTPAEIEALELAANQAHNEAARTAMEVERARANSEAAAQALREADAQLQRFQPKAPQEPDDGQNVADPAKSGK